MIRSTATILALAFALADGPAAADALLGAPASSGAGIPAADLTPAETGACGGTSEAPCPSPDQAESSPSTAANPGSGKGVPERRTAAEPFALKDVKGRPLTFDPKPLQKPALLVFWSIFCEPCKEEMPLFGYVGDKYAGEGLRVLGVNLDGANMAGAADRFLQMNRIGFPSAVDRKEGKRFVTAAAYGVTGTPSLFLVGAGGEILWTHVGRVQAADLEAAVRSSLGM